MIFSLTTASSGVDLEIDGCRRAPFAEESHSKLRICRNLSQFALWSFSAFVGITLMANCIVFRINQRFRLFSMEY